MAFQFVISEDDNDGLFYQLCVERITGRAFDVDPLHLRRGGGINKARKALPVLLQILSHTGPVDDTFFIATLDNDRSRAHPGHEHALDPNKISRLPKHEQDKPCRFCELQRVVEQHLGARGSWPIGGAIAVPVQMLESWLLLISNPAAYREESALPLFPRRDAPLAKKYFKPKTPPDQLKDLRDREKERLGLETTRAFCLHCAEALDPDDLAARSPSFSLFREQVLGWVSGC